MNDSRDEPEAESRGFDVFGASPLVPGQGISRQALTELDQWLASFEANAHPAWEVLWRELCAERVPIVGKNGELALTERGQARSRRRWNWRKALYIAWKATPKRLRQPGTLEELADLLGVNSGTIRNWRRNDPEIDERVKTFPRKELMEHLVDVYDALVQVATTPEPSAHQDRKLFLELVDEYTPGSRVDAELTVRDDDARQRLARLLGAEDAGGTEGGGDPPTEQ